LDKGWFENNFCTWWSWHVLKENVEDWDLKERKKSSKIISKGFWVMIVTCVQRGCWRLELQRAFFKWWNRTINDQMCWSFKFLCYFKIILFGISYYVFVFVKLILYNYLWNFMWLQVSCVATLKHMDTTIIVFHICQFEIFIKLGNVFLKFFTLSTFFPWQFWKFSTSQFLTNFLQI
jgi:hypothetical protein